MKSKFNWKEFEKEAEIENQIRGKFEILRKEIIKSKETPFKDKSNEYTKDFGILLDLKIEEILDCFQNFPLKNKKTLKNKFNSSLKRDLDLIFNKKALCLISFRSIAIFKFFQVISTIFDDIKIEIQQNKLYICEIDASRKVLMEINIFNKNYVFFREGKINLDLINLRNVLKAKKGDESQTSIIIGENKLFIEIYSKKYKCSLKRILNNKTKDEKTKNSVQELKKINYPCRFQLTKEKLMYLKDNFGLYSEKINIVCSKNQIKFTERGQIGFNELIWENKQENEVMIDLQNIKSDQEDFIKNTDKIIQDELENSNRKIKRKHEIRGKFWIEYFDTCLKIMKFLKESHKIIFFMQEKKPLKSEIKIENLGETVVRFYFDPWS